jgi:glyoxylase-like metal-dependent hydrolase (beta-lactamase superfamily II)
MRLYTINAGHFKLDGGAMFGVVPKSMWNKINAADENNLCSWAMRCLLIEDGNKLILVDTGMGDKQDQKFFSHYYLHGNDTLDKSLKTYGFHRDDITDVFLTHLHFDHCGGAIINDGGRLVPAFKNAVYWSNDLHWNWAVNPNDREKASFLKENILPILESGRLNLIQGLQPFENKRAGDKLEVLESGLLDTLSIRIADGHTRAMMLPQIKYKGRTIVYMADLLPSTGHIPLPYVMAYDMFPLTTLAEKKSFLQEALDNEYLLYFEHDPQHECCSLQKTERGIRPAEYFRLEDI